MLEDKQNACKIYVNHVYNVHLSLMFDMYYFYQRHIYLVNGELIS